MLVLQPQIGLTAAVGTDGGDSLHSELSKLLTRRIQQRNVPNPE